MVAKSGKLLCQGRRGVQLCDIAARKCTLVRKDGHANVQSFAFVSNEWAEWTNGSVLTGELQHRLGDDGEPRVWRAQLVLSGENGTCVMVSNGVSFGAPHDSQVQHS